MPELPEVETVKKVLSEQIVGNIISKIDILYKPIVIDEANYFKAKCENQTITAIDRLGKYLIIRLKEGAIISHLRMEGKYFYVPVAEINDKHVHVVFYLNNGYMLLYQDVRKFGRMVYKENSDIYKTHPLNELGYEPISKEKVSEEEILKKINKKKLPIKSVLLDQSIICGLGNIYVDEVLFAAQILPTREGKTITLEEVKKILSESRGILTKAIRYKGTTIRSYTSSLGVIGGYQNFLNVHTKTTCPICEKKLTKIKIGGRTTYFCPNCQR